MLSELELDQLLRKSAVAERLQQADARFVASVESRLNTQHRSRQVLPVAAGLLAAFIAWPLLIAGSVPSPAVDSGVFSSLVSAVGESLRAAIGWLLEPVPVQALLENAPTAGSLPLTFMLVVALGLFWSMTTD